ncbi:MAG: hypothetical protein WC244_03100 [Patescibacteria group bacterium]|jgi:hypothetical protein
MVESKSLNANKTPLITGGIELLGQCFSIFSKKWKKLIWLLFLIPLIVAGLSFFVGIFFALLASLVVATKIALTWKIALGVVSGVLAVSGVLFAIFISVISNIGAVYIVDSEMTVKEALKKSVSLFWKYLGWAILFGIIVMVGFLLFIVPGIIISIMFSLSALVLVLEGAGPIGALKRSKELVKGFWWTILARFMVIGIFAVLLSIVASLVNSMGTSLLEFGVKNPAVMVLAVVVAIVTFVFSIAVNFIVGSISMIYGYLIYKQLQECKNSDASVRDGMSTGKKVGLGMIVALATIFAVITFLGFILLVSLASMDGVTNGASSTAPTSITQDLQSQLTAPDVK